MITNDIIHQLQPRQLQLLTWIYNQCIASNQVTITNKEIGEVNNIPESTVEKYLKLFDELGLIIRESKRDRDYFTHEWRTVSRSISLNPSIFKPELLALERTARMDNLFDLLNNPDFMRKSAEKKLRGT